MSGHRSNFWKSANNNNEILRILNKEGISIAFSMYLYILKGTVRYPQCQLNAIQNELEYYNFIVLLLICSKCFDFSF